ncbi:putative helicase mov-10-B.1 [Scomber japonicus]|uniref:putative helicase mov-10-B.1 n=1 Tax=Scomber japonicus TaxID=13676 RepID=UPI00230677C8|nr:putative helicase mov-10-B.1 [Scomber japonicus]
MTHVEPLREGSRGRTNRPSSAKPWPLEMQLFPGPNYWQVATPFWQTESSPQALGYMLLNLPTGMFHKWPAGKLSGAKRKNRQLRTANVYSQRGLLSAESGQVVLAGDPKQLGPILRSPFVLKYGMGVSLLERMMNDFPLYQKEEDVFNKRFVTKLLHNYRSHPAILKIPNELFYDGELQVCADEMLRNSYCNWEYLPRRDFPVIFHGVTGIDEREASSPSFFNIAEVEVLMDYVKKLLATKAKKGLAVIRPRDIGIIAPYRKQVLKIHKALHKVGVHMDTLKVGSVEEFQGQERRVILVSTVRSSPDYAEIDKQFTVLMLRGNTVL